MFRIVFFSFIPFTLLCISLLSSSSTAATNVVKQGDTPTVILISIDGFAHKYLQQYQPPNILDLVKSGVTSKSLQPVFPSKTFPNHLSIITGMYPANHGLVHNKFYHPRLDEIYSLGAGRKNSDWLTALPLWIVAEQQNIKTGVYFWPESEAVINGFSPRYNKPYKKSTTNQERVDTIISWLSLPQAQQPKFIASYFSTVDTAGHHFGPNSPEVAQAIADIDELIGYLVKRLTKEVSSPIDIILVSDHGMALSGEINAIELSAVISEDISLMTGVTIVNGQTQIYVNFAESVSAKNRALVYQQVLAKRGSSVQYQIKLKGHYPSHWHFNNSSPLIPDIIINAIPPYSFTKKGDKNSVATHGYDAKGNADLQAIFIANGPSFRKGIEIDAFENINIFPLIANILSLEIPKNIDGKLSVLAPILITTEIQK